MFKRPDISTGYIRALADHFDLSMSQFLENVSSDDPITKTQSGLGKDTIILLLEEKNKRLEDKEEMIISLKEQLAERTKLYKELLEELRQLKK